TGFVFMAIVGGGLATRLRTFLFTGTAGALLLLLLDLTNWFKRPSMGLIGIALFAIAASLIVAGLTTGLRDRPALIAFGLAGVVAPLALSFPMQYLFFLGNAGWTILAAIAIFAVIGAIVGFALGGDRKANLARLAALAGALGVLPLVIDQMFQRW